MGILRNKELEIPRSGWAVPPPLMFYNPSFLVVNFFTVVIFIAPDGIEMFAIVFP